MTDIPTLEEIAQSIRDLIYALRDSGDIRQIDMLTRNLHKIEEFQRQQDMDIARHIATSDGRPR